MSHKILIAHRRNRPFWIDGTLYDSATNIFSGWHGYSHTELIFQDGFAFSSMVKSKEVRGGCQFFKRTEGYPENLWRLTTLEMDSANYWKIYEKCCKLVDEQLENGGGYDVRGVLRFVFRWMDADKEDYFCSEACVEALRVGDYAPPTLCLAIKQLTPHKASPNTVAKACGL